MSEEYTNQKQQMSEEEHDKVEPLHVSDDTFEAAVLKAPLPVLVDFWAPWCGPCRRIAPVIEDLAQEYDGRALVAKVNTDDNTQWATHYQVHGIPTLLFIANGQVVDRLVGAHPYPVIKQHLDAVLEQRQ